MFRVRRRGTTRTTSLVLLAVLTASWLFLPTSVSASSIAVTQKQISDLSAALSRQEIRSEVTSNQYDAEMGDLASINTNIVNLQSQEAQKQIGRASRRERV